MANVQSEKGCFIKPQVPYIWTFNSILGTPCTAQAPNAVNTGLGEKKTLLPLLPDLIYTSLFSQTRTQNGSQHSPCLHFYPGKVTQEGEKISQMFSLSKIAWGGKKKHG